ncbi:hypothetical protein [Thalassotalea sediminis]|uniref:hypothetical protein n=1 Tax=Thalassotalea sediminis TaxID=1759089 RepID=UPI002572D08A|nr:hypothetical protein [Thalassotalea sediminis]
MANIIFLMPFIFSTSAYSSTVLPSEQVQQVEIRPGHARALKSLDDEKYKDDNTKVLVSTISELTDSTGLTYLGAKINRVELEKFLAQLKLILGKNYQQYRLNQATRDTNSFHVTLVAPADYQMLNKSEAPLGQSMRITLHGLGRVSQGNNTSYFVVASSNDGDFMRQNLRLPAKDFHVTLGFDKSDVYGVSKGMDTLIEQ